MTSETSLPSQANEPERLSILTLMGAAAPSGVSPAKLYRAQLFSVDRVWPLHLALNMLAVLFVCVFFYASVGPVILALWGVPAVATSLAGARASRWRVRQDYVSVARSDLLGQGLVSLIQGVLWTLPMILFGWNGTVEQVVALWTLASCLMMGAAISFAALPLATVGFLVPVGLGGIWLFRSAAIDLRLVIASYALLLLLASLKHSREFGRQVSTSTALAEKTAVVSLLLREYEHEGADWLWQTDTSRCISGVSPRFAEILGKEPAELEGVPFLRLLAGARWDSGDFTSGMRDVAERMKRRESFSAIVMPVEVQGIIRWWELSASPMTDEKGQFQGFRGVGSDVTEQRESADKIAQLARFDPLTDLPNRLQLSEALQDAILSADKWKRRSAFLMIDLDRFKSVNDTLGHQVGDRLLARVADRLRQVCTANEVCGRIGGDEFGVVIREAESSAHIDTLARSIIDTLSQPYDVDQHTLYIGASIGSAVAPRDGHNTETLIRSADLALYRAKDEGGGKHCVYEPRLHSNAEERRTLEIALREALEKNQLYVVYQPVVNAATGTIEGFESLVRWTHPEMGNIPPIKFIPVAEDARLIGPIGEWVLRTACHEAMNWPDDIRVSVNVSAEQLGNPAFVTSVMSALAQSGLPPARLELEVTESVFMREGNGAIQVLEQLLALGIRLSLDDFGTGYSSLGYLSRTKFSTIKIDRSFVVGASKNVPESLAIIRAVVALAQSLGMATTAEGVETESEVEMVNRLGCTKIQGYYFGRPMPAQEARALFGRSQATAVA